MGTESGSRSRSILAGICATTVCSHNMTLPRVSVKYNCQSKTDCAVQAVGLVDSSCVVNLKWIRPLCDQHPNGATRYDIRPTI